MSASIKETNAQKISKVADWLEQQVLDSSITDETIWNKLKLSKSSFYRLKPKALLELNKRSQKRQKHFDAVTATETIKAARNGLKSKLERVLLLQDQIDELLLDLENSGNKVSITDKAYLRKTIKDIQAEISKIEGDYAPNKKEVSANMDLSISNLPNIPTEDLIKYLSVKQGNNI